MGYNCATLFLNWGLFRIGAKAQWDTYYINQGTSHITARRSGIFRVFESVKGKEHKYLINQMYAGTFLYFVYLLSKFLPMFVLLKKDREKNHIDQIFFPKWKFLKLD